MGDRTKIDIHNYYGRFKRALAGLRRSELSMRNKKFISRFDTFCAAAGIGVARRAKYLNTLQVLGRWFKKDFDKVTKQDVEKVVIRVEGRRDFSIWTKHDYKVVTKRFFRWLLGGDEHYPEQVRWISTNINKRDLPLPKQNELVTQEDVDRLIATASTARDRALVAVLFESGCRIGELMSLRIRDVFVEDFGMLLNVNGKTGDRRVTIISSVPYLASWFNVHPYRGDPVAPVWLNLGNKNSGKPMAYSTVSAVLRRLFHKAGIRKPFRPHLFRHARATLLSQVLTEFQMNYHFGWVQGSRMPSIYIHMDGGAVKDRLLELHGIKSGTRNPKSFSVKRNTCRRCKFENPGASSYCGRCGAVLDLSKGVHLARSERGLVNMLIEMKKRQTEMAKVIEELSGKRFEIVLPSAKSVKENRSQRESC